MTMNAYSQVRLIYHFLQGKENIAEEKNVKVKEEVGKYVKADFYATHDFGTLEFTGTMTTCTRFS